MSNETQLAIVLMGTFAMGAVVGWYAGWMIRGLWDDTWKRLATDTGSKRQTSTEQYGETWHGL